MRLITASAALVLFAGLAFAGEYAGSLKKVANDSIVVEVAGAEKTLKVKDASKVKVNLTVGKDKTVVDSFEKLSTAKLGKKGLNVTVVTEGEGEKEVVTEIKAGKKKKKDSK